MKQHRHFILHKPYGYLSQFVNNQTKRRNKKLLGDIYNFPDGTMSIGRLDEKSEGLLLLTTDGKVSEQVRSKQVEKEYLVQLDGKITAEQISEIRKGVEITIHKSKYKTLPCQAGAFDPSLIIDSLHRKIRDDKHGPTSWIKITLIEGKFKQIRKMTAKVGFPTLRLIRVRIGDVTLGALPLGAVKEIDDFFNII